MNHRPLLSAPSARHLNRQAARALLSACALLGLSTARAEADGPDFYRLREAPPQGLAVHLAPHSPWRAGWLPRGAQCLRNLGCQGGLSFQAFSTLTPEGRAQAEAAHPRWCQVAWQGLRGWVEGRALAEASQACATQEASSALTLKAGRAQIQGQIRGDQAVLRVLQAQAGQTLSLGGGGSHPQTGWLLRRAGSPEALLISETANTPAQVRLPADGAYVLQVFLNRAAARRGASSRFKLDVALSGTGLPARPAAADARVAGTPFHATATLPCQLSLAPDQRSCEAGVIRRGFDGSATVHLQAANTERQLLFVAGQPVSSDSALPLIGRHEGELWVIEIGSGSERYELPEALLTGG